MRELSPGWATDLAVLLHAGSTVEDRGDHLVVRTPHSPLFHWGNCLLVTDDEAVDDATRWVAAFHEAFPDAGWISVGLTSMPADGSAWAEHGVTLELDEVLTTGRLPRQTPAPNGYEFHRLSSDDDWEQQVIRDLADNERTGKHEPESHERFVRDQHVPRHEMCERDVAAFFGAFHEGTLVADLGIVVCGSRARYQNVGTDPDHRERGLASHLLGLAASWAADRGCDSWVIVTEATNPAGRVYRRAGFEPDTANVQAYRPPPR